MYYLYIKVKSFLYNLCIFLYWGNLMQKNKYMYGYQPLREIIRHQPQRVQRLFLQQQRSDERVQELLQWAQAAKIPVAWVSKGELDEMLGSRQHQGMAIQCSRIGALSESM